MLELGCKFIRMLKIYSKCLNSVTRHSFNPSVRHKPSLLAHGFQNHSLTNRPSPFYVFTIRFLEASHKLSKVYIFVVKFKVLNCTTLEVIMDVIFHCPISHLLFNSKVVFQRFQQFIDKTYVHINE